MPSYWTGPSTSDRSPRALSRVTRTGTGPSRQGPVPESLPGWGVYENRSLWPGTGCIGLPRNPQLRGPVSPARDRSPRAELSGLSQIFIFLAGYVYGNWSLTPGTGPREQNPAKCRIALFSEGSWTVVRPMARIPRNMILSSLNCRSVFAIVAFYMYPHALGVSPELCTCKEKGQEALHTSLCDFLDFSLPRLERLGTAEGYRPELACFERRTPYMCRHMAGLGALLGGPLSVPRRDMNKEKIINI
uniref:Uncharacterized protein n=1 Tax=Ananas comosus var. bracteatus TaxID=296719 RepID=A0A6V7P9L9_ANACO|nr:unnamed protein product [Ananas comosus var. bracteatus]